ncbi:MAG: methylmalonyl-CoA mutase [Deltaproteobacteria bacterium]|nr:methylmalonyl-CoA mutase [Deltaproteobacteria bacterium]
MSKDHINKGQKTVKNRFASNGGSGVKPLYQPDNIAEKYLEKGGFPGEPPFTRGIHPEMYRSRLWTMRQYAGFGSAAETNKRFRFLIEKGITGLSVAFDLPTQLGLDSDDGRARGEVGRVGVAVSSIEDMERLLDGIPLGSVSTSMTINATAPVILAMYIAAAKRQGVREDELSGTVQNDILKEYIARGNYIYPYEPSLKLASDIFEYCSLNVPRWYTISISGYHMREAGADAVQELAFTFANGCEYVARALARGLDVNKFGKRLSFFFACHNNFLEEIAKFRAARRIWCRIMRDRFGATDNDALALRFHTQTSGCTLTAAEPQNNIVRVAIQALAAVLGGTQSLHTNSRDEALSLPTEESVKIALRTQQIIAHESHVIDTVDPLGGSYYIEALTDHIERNVIDYLKKIESNGGVKQAVESGFFQKEIQRSAYRQQMEIESKEQVVVGVNEFREGAFERIEPQRVDPEIEAAQTAGLRRFKEKRNQTLCMKSMEELKTATEKGLNLMPFVIRSVESNATVGEISALLGSVYGYFPDKVFI